MRNFIIAGLIMAVAGCNSNTSADFTTVKVKEVEQVGSYTYLLVKGKGPEYWIAGPSMEASPGETYHYQGGLLMEEFYSKELNRTFDKVLFLDAMFAGSAGQKQKSKELQVLQGPEETEEFSYEAMVTIEKSNVDVEAVEGTIRISDIFSDPTVYEGKLIRVAGEVTKYNAAIMERNWVHI
ncbi:MAG: hypothetical protein KAS29_11390, partial [Bacteroidales bacterium]|nr:hypothetical protein [Bacteroidales bacterium]